MEYLEKWAKEEFLTVPQMARIIVKRAIAARQANQNGTPAAPVAGGKSRGKKGGEK